METLRMVDPEVADAIEEEGNQQDMTIELNAATNLCSRAVLEAQGNLFACKTLEGYPGSRYHGGHSRVDVIEKLAVERAKKLFGAEHANIQPHSGVSANLAVYFATLNPGDAILGMDLAMGGHLSHGHKGTFSGKFLTALSYGVEPESGRIDYGEVARTARKEKPKMIVCGGSAYPRIIDFAQFRAIADDVGAFLMADIAHVAGLVAGGVYPSPVPYADFVTFTTYKTLRGSRGGTILCKKAYAGKVDKAVFPGVQGSMHVHMMAGKAVTFKLAARPSFRVYAQQVVENAKALAKALAERSYRIVTGGTDTHIVLLDLRGRELTGAEAQKRLEEAGIICNKNAVPFDSRGPESTSGVRLGTASITTRGFGEPEMVVLAEMIDTVLDKGGERKQVLQVQKSVRELCRRFPINCESASP
jgi:glycine hydroxymethyltransferase